MVAVFASQDGVIVLFHFAELHEHSATSIRPKATVDGPGVSSVNRYRVKHQALTRKRFAVDEMAKLSR